MREKRAREKLRLHELKYASTSKVQETDMKQKVKTAKETGLPKIQERKSLSTFLSAELTRSQREAIILNRRGRSCSEPHVQVLQKHHLTGILSSSLQGSFSFHKGDKHRQSIAIMTRQTLLQRNDSFTFSGEDQHSILLNYVKRQSVRLKLSFDKNTLKEALDYLQDREKFQYLNSNSQEWKVITNYLTTDEKGKQLVKDYAQQLVLTKNLEKTDDSLDLMKSVSHLPPIGLQKVHKKRNSIGDSRLRSSLNDVQWQELKHTRQAKTHHSTESNPSINRRRSSVPNVSRSIKLFKTNPNDSTGSVNKNSVNDTSTSTIVTAVNTRPASITEDPTDKTLYGSRSSTNFIDIPS